MKSRNYIVMILAFACSLSIGVAAEATTIPGDITSQTEERLSILVLGEVRSQGKHNLPEKSSIADAIQAAGGLSRYARKQGIKVTREKPDGSIETLEVDLTLPENQRKPVILLSEDIVYVPAACIY